MRMLSMPAARLLALLAVGIAAVAVACGGSSEIEDPQDVVVGATVEFTIPGVMTQVGTPALETPAGRWESADFSLVMSPGSLEELAGSGPRDELSQTFLTIDGHEATVERFLDPNGDATRPYVAVVRFANGFAGQELTIVGRAADEDRQDTLMDIYKTVKWLESKDA